MARFLVDLMRRFRLAGLCPLRKPYGRPPMRCSLSAPIQRLLTRFVQVRTTAQRPSSLPSARRQSSLTPVSVKCISRQPHEWVHDTIRALRPDTLRL